MKLLSRPRYFLHCLLCIVGLLNMALAVAAPLQAGRDYSVIDPPLGTTKDKIEVIEFFSYGCPHCNDFHGLIDAWAAKLPKDVVLRRVPVSFNRPPWAKLARLYYSLEANGEVNRLNGEVFKALHQDRINLNNDDALASWATQHGLDAKKLTSLMTSFGVQSLAARADQEAVAAKINGVPSLVVNGKYLLINEAAGSYEELLKRTDQLIASERGKGK